MHRSKEIEAKLDFALECSDRLFDDIVGAQSSNADVRHLGEKAGTVLSACRECFDYAARDIYETYVLNASRNPGEYDRYVRGRLRVYFPFHRNQLLGKQPFAPLKNSHPAVYSRLEEFVSGIERDAVLGPMSQLRFRMFAEANAMVDQKKHDRIISSLQRPDATTVITGNGTAVGVHPVGKQQGFANGAIEMKGGAGIQIAYVKDFFFEFNGERVNRFCKFLINGTSIYLREMYAVIFGEDPELMDPCEKGDGAN